MYLFFSVATQVGLKKIIAAPIEKEDYISDWDYEEDFGHRDYVAMIFNKHIKINYPPIWLFCCYDYYDFYVKKFCASANYYFDVYYNQEVILFWYIWEFDSQGG